MYTYMCGIYIYVYIYRCKTRCFSARTLQVAKAQKTIMAAGERFSVFLIWHSLKECWPQLIHTCIHIYICVYIYIYVHIHT